MNVCAVSVDTNHGCTPSPNASATAARCSFDAGGSAVPILRAAPPTASTAAPPLPLPPGCSAGPSASTSMASAAPRSAFGVLAAGGEAATSVPFTAAASPGTPPSDFPPSGFVISCCPPAAAFLAAAAAVDGAAGRVSRGGLALMAALLSTGGSLSCLAMLESRWGPPDNLSPSVSSAAATAVCRAPNTRSASPCCEATAGDAACALLPPPWLVRGSRVAR
mmetsp:Transcript_3674/g.10649  ORF Transcript_3674/g.10649 Transcript_3674/m.10649 type:complete len:221 (-) Transcript_3674:382-1044(-)